MQQVGNERNLETKTCSDSNDDLYRSLLSIDGRIKSMDDGSTCCSTTCLDDSTSSFISVLKVDAGEDQDSVVGVNIEKVSQSSLAIMDGTHPAMQTMACEESSNTIICSPSWYQENHQILLHRHPQQSPRPHNRPRLMGRRRRTPDESRRNTIRPPSISIKTLPRELLITEESKVE